MSLNFLWRMEQHFSDFAEKRTTLRGLRWFLEISVPFAFFSRNSKISVENVAVVSIEDIHGRHKQRARPAEHNSDIDIYKAEKKARC